MNVSSFLLYHVYVYFKFFFAQYVLERNDEMNQVPVMISTKDLAYLSDMFEWNFTACKIANHYYEEVTQENLKNHIKKVADLHKKNCEKCIQMLGGNYES